MLSFKSENPSPLNRQSERYILVSGVREVDDSDSDSALSVLTVVLSSQIRMQFGLIVEMVEQIV